MNRSYGPWATLIAAGRNPQLSAFWRRRLGRLAPVSHAGCELSRRHVLGLATMALLVCLLPTVRALPVRAEQSKPAPAPAAGSGKGVGAGASPSAAEPSPSRPVAGATRAADQGNAGSDSPPLDPKTKALGEAALKLLGSTWADAQTTETMVLKDGQAGLMTLKKNATPVAQIKITPHIVNKGTRFDLDAIDAAGKPIAGCKTTSSSIQNKQCLSLGKDFTVNGQDILPQINLKATHREDGRVAVNVMVQIETLPTQAEIEAMLLCLGKKGQVQLDFGAIGRWIWEYRNRTGHAPQTLAELHKPLPKDRYSPTGADYHYERQRTRYILSSCGKDGIYGNADDDVCVSSRAGVTSGEREVVYPLEEEKDPPDEEKVAAAQTAKPHWEPLPRGDCALSGKVVSAATGKPIAGAMLYLFYVPTYSPAFVNSAGDGSFQFQNLPRGPFSLQASHAPGYQDLAYNPQGTPGLFPQFSLADRERRSGIVLKAQPACSVSGRIVDEKGEVPENVETLEVLAWCKCDDGQRYESRQAGVTSTDGSYLIDGLDERPVYVMAMNWRAAQQGQACPPIYYPGTFSRSDAKQVTFAKTRSVDHVDIRLRKDGGLTLEGTVRDEAGKPVPEAFVVVHRPDMCFDLLTAYTDAQGHYRIQGLGDGEFLVHVDAVHRGLVRMRTPIDIARAAQNSRLDFSLTRGAAISGKFVDEKGHAWQIVQSHGLAFVNTKENNFTLTSFRNKHRLPDSQARSQSPFALGKGNYTDAEMLFPTSSTFLIQGLLPGHASIEFAPQKEGQTTRKILYQGRDIMASGIDTRPGQAIQDVTIVIGRQ